MRIKAFMYILIGAMLLAPAIASPQQADQDTQGYYLITDPSGATVYLDGEYSLITNTPARLPSNLSGKYKTKIVMPGYENWKGELNFAPGAPNSVKIDLSRKTPIKSGLRSLFIPGWGQHYSGNSTRGGMYILGALVSVGGLYLADQRYQDKRADYDIARQRYIDATSFPERAERKVVLDAAQRIAYKAENDRRTVMYIGIGVWALNVLDAVLFFPDNDVVVPSVNTSNEGGVMLNYIIDF